LPPVVAFNSGNFKISAKDVEKPHWDHYTMRDGRNHAAFFWNDTHGCAFQA
jgi:hypothetical protein